VRSTGHILILRRITLILVFAAVLASLALDTGLGTPSALGIGEFFLLCPLGGAEAMLASRTFIPMAAVSMLVVLLLALLVGRAWCAWGCPAPKIRSFFKRQPPPEVRPRRTRRNGTLALVLVASLALGFPVFCLVCPIGLTFGAVISLWRLFVFKQVTVSVLVFPACLALELVLYRRWCLNLCPVAALLALLGRGARLLRPSVDASKCLLYQSDDEHTACKVCARACAERIDLHSDSAARDLQDCTRCGECQSACPVQAIKIKVKPSKPVSRW
jgi:ferredoxin-type protein NapH